MITNAAEAKIIMKEYNEDESYRWAKVQLADLLFVIERKAMMGQAAIQLGNGLSEPLQNLLRNAGFKYEEKWIPGQNFEVTISWM